MTTAERSPSAHVRVLLRKPRTSRRVLLAGLVCGAVTLCAPAVAVAGVTHSLVSSCSGAGTAAGRLAVPRGVAVDEASEEVFVMDRQGDPPGVQRFSLAGGMCTFVEALTGAGIGGIYGEDVALGGGRLFVANTQNFAVDVFEVGAGEHLLFQITGAATPPKSIQPRGVAVADGVVYVADGGNDRVDEFSASAVGEEYLGGFSTEPYGEPGRLAVDGAGDVLVIVKGHAAGTSETVPEVVELTKAGALVRTFGLGAEAVAVDRGTGDVFVGFGNYVEEFNEAGGLVSRFGGPAVDNHELEGGGLAVDEASGEVFVSDDEPVGKGDPLKGSLDVFAASSEAPSVSTGEVSGVSQTGVTLAGVVNPESTSLPASYVFEYASEAEYAEECGGRPEVLWEGLCGRFTHVVPVSPVSVGTGTAGVPVGAPVTGLSPDTSYRYRLVGFNANADGSNGRVEGETLPFITPGPPVVGSEQAVVKGPGEATLKATVTPEGADTHYFFEYGAGDEYGSRVPASSVDVGAGRVGVSVSEAVSALAPEAEYHFRVVASSSEGTTYGTDRTFRTFAAPALGLPDGRGYELVSRLAGSSDGEDGSVYSPGLFLGHATVKGPQPFEASPEGDAMAYMGDPSGEGNGILGNEYLSSRTGGGWVSRDVSPPTEGLTSECAGGILSVSAPYELFSAGLGVGVTVMVATPALVAATGAPACYLNVFVRETSLASSETGSYRALITTKPPDRSSTEFGFAPPSANSSPIADNIVAGGSGDVGQVFLAVNDALVPGAPNGGLLKDDLYEASPTGGLRLVSVLPNNGTGVAGASFGSARPLSEPEAPPDETRAISNDGGRVFWTDSASTPSGLYLREDGERTVQVDKSRGGLGASGGGAYWTASTDGSRAFFTDASQLTKEADASSGANLYEFEAECEHLTDLTGGHTRAGVQGVLGASEDGSIVYFVAEGALTGSETNTAGQTATEGANNLYVYHAGAEHTLRFLARLNPQDDDIRPGERITVMRLGDWRGSVAQQTERVSGDGGSVVLVSQEQLTGYANDGHEEVYSYSLAEGSFTCVSCNPTGSSHGEAVLIPDTTNAYQPRWVSEDGSRVFFDTTEALAAGDENETWDVYEWERGGTGSCTKPAGCQFLISSGKTRDGALFDDATPDGSDVFFTTRGKLTPEDTDEQSNLFDARVGGGFPYTTPVANCGSESACRAPESTPPALSASASATFTGPGNPTPAPPPAVKPAKPGLTRAQKLTRALAACRKKHSHSRPLRTRCERTARRALAAKRAARPATNDRRGPR